MEERHDAFVQVQIVTTSGSYPEKGHDRVPSHQKVKIQLAEAARKLELTDTTGWVAVVTGREIDPEKSWTENREWN
jgi:hypothetical protein